MAKVTFKAALNAAKFPLLYATGGQEVLDPGMDVAPRVNPAFAGGVNNVDWNLIQPQYVQNMLPTETGYLSVDIIPKADKWDVALPPSVAVGALSAVHDNGTKLAWVVISALIPPDVATLAHIICIAPAVQKVYTFPLGTNYDAAISSVNGRIFIGASNASGPYHPVEITASSGTVTAATFTYPGGFSANDVRGMCASGNYNILHTKTEILWSTPTNPTDFANTSLGAGRQIPNDLLGPIVTCVPIGNGFIIYTDRNAVAAIATNNASTPFRFVSIPGSAGAAYRSAVAGDSNSAAHYVLQHTGFQRVTLREAEHFAPEVFKYVNTQRQTVVSSAVALPTEGRTARDVLPDSANTSRLRLISQRYLVMSVIFRRLSISSGQSQNYDMLIYDLAHDRWSRIRTVDYMFDVVEVGPISPSNSSGYLGNILAIPSNLSSTLSSQVPQAIVRQKSKGEVLTGPISCMILGRVQLRRSRTVTVTSVEVTGIYSPLAADLGGPDAVTTPACTALVSSTGADRETAVPMTLVESDTGYWRFDGRVTGKNIDFLLTGRWEITSVVVTGQIHGIR